MYDWYISLERSLWNLRMQENPLAGGPARNQSSPPASPVASILAQRCHEILWGQDSWGAPIRPVPVPLATKKVCHVMRHIRLSSNLFIFYIQLHDTALAFQRQRRLSRNLAHLPRQTFFSVHDGGNERINPGEERSASAICLRATELENDWGIEMTDQMYDL